MGRGIRGGRCWCIEGLGFVLSQVSKSRLGAPGICARPRWGGWGSCYPRSQNRDLGHPAFVRGRDGAVGVRAIPGLKIETWGTRPPQGFKMSDCQIESCCLQIHYMGRCKSERTVAASQLNREDQRQFIAPPEWSSMGKFREYRITSCRVAKFGFKERESGQ